MKKKEKKEQLVNMHKKNIMMFSTKKKCNEKKWEKSNMQTKKIQIK